MTQITLEDLEVTSFFTDEDEDGKWKLAYTEDKGCEYTSPAWECICTGDISTCSRTSIEGGCDTSVQCVTAGC